VRPKRAVGDTTYGTAANIRALEDAGVRAYVPLADRDGRTAYDGPSRFAYDAARDQYRCPQGQPLRRWKANRAGEAVTDRAAAAACNACPVKAACAASPRGRMVQRSVHAAYLERVRAYHATPAYEKAMRKRKVWIEPLFAEAKQWHGLHRFRLRGVQKVNRGGCSWRRARTSSAGWPRPAGGAATARAGASSPRRQTRAGGEPRLTFWVLVIRQFRVQAGRPVPERLFRGVSR
jgi:hypothetical protein